MNGDTQQALKQFGGFETRHRIEAASSKNSPDGSSLKSERPEAPGQAEQTKQLEQAKQPREPELKPNAR
jgi:hypothetical protein